MALEEVKTPSIDQDLIDALTKKLREVGFLDVDQSVSLIHPTFSKNPKFKGYSIDLMLNQFWTPRGPCPDCGREVNGWYDFLVHLITCGTIQ